MPKGLNKDDRLAEKELYMLPSPLQSLWTNTTGRLPTVGSYPPADIYYNKSDESTCPDIVIDMALAGFTKNEITVSLIGTELVIEGKHINDRSDIVMIHQGISRKSFSRRIDLGSPVKVKSCSMDNGILTIILVHERASTAHIIPIN